LEEILRSNEDGDTSIFSRDPEIDALTQK